MGEIAGTNDMKARMLAANIIVPVQKPEEMLRYLLDDIRANLEVIKKNNIKVD
jgi:hypothetical protein